MSEKEKEIIEKKEENEEKNNSFNKNVNNENINIINNSNIKDNDIKDNNNENKNEVDNASYSYNTPKSSYGNTYPSPFSSISKSKSKNEDSKSNHSYSKNSNHRSRSKSYEKSKSPNSHSKSIRSHKNYHHKPRSIPQVFIRGLNYYVTKRDIEKEFIRFGDIKNLTIKRGFAFVEFYDPKDAKYAIKELDGRKLFGQSNRIVVEEAKISKEEREKRKNRSRSREKDREDNKDRERNRDKDYYYKRRTGPKKTDICYNCGKEGHWANECHENRRNR